MKPARKRWWTLAWLDRKGRPHLSHQHPNHVQNFCRGAHVVSVWEGQLSEEIARSRKPKFYVYQDGHVQELE